MAGTIRSGTIRSGDRPGAWDSDLSGLIRSIMQAIGEAGTTRSGMIRSSMTVRYTCTAGEAGIHHVTIMTGISPPELQEPAWQGSL